MIKKIKMLTKYITKIKKKSIIDEYIYNIDNKMIKNDLKYCNYK